MNEYLPALLELTRGKVIESIHYGAIAVVDSSGNLLYSCGDPQTIAFLRSSAKPFQALPFFEYGGPERLGLSQKEQAILCASHEGTDEHVRIVERIQAKTGIRESDLQCGIHMPGDAKAYKSLIAHNRAPGPNRTNCSGKHSGMLAYAKLRGLPLDTYLDLNHPIQQEILTSFAEMSGCTEEQIAIGVDGCSAPNFAVPLFNAALAYARLCDPRYLEDRRKMALRNISSAMTSHPEMISGQNEFDCRLMQVGGGNIICKRGAEGFQAVGIMPGIWERDSAGIGIAVKISDGDQTYRTIDLEPHNRVRPAITLEILHQMGLLSHLQATELSGFGPILPVRNHRGIVVGEAKPVFRLQK